MKRGAKKYLSVIGVVVVSLSVMFILASFNSPPKRKPAADNRPTVSVLEVHNQEILLSVPVIGRLSAHNRVDILAEVSGVLQANTREFLAGRFYQAGEIMLQIDREESELTLMAQRSNLLTAIASLLPELKFDYPESYRTWNTYLQNFNLNETTQSLPESQNEREKYFVANKGIFSSYYQIKSLESRLEKYTIRAPFDGVLIENHISAGNLVRSGQLLGVFIDPSEYDFMTRISIEDMPYIAIGDMVSLQSEHLPGQWSGRVVRINQDMDMKTQMVEVFVSVSGDQLRENMFLNGDILTGSSVRGIQLPRKMLQDGNKVLELVDGIVQYRHVEVIAVSGETAIVTGLADGTRISRQIQNLYPGVEVKMQLTGQPADTAFKSIAG